ncbi:hypothetical protein D3C85_921010 [compost metagenome]
MEALLEQGAAIIDRLHQRQCETPSQYPGTLEPAEKPHVLTVVRKGHYTELCFILGHGKRGENQGHWAHRLPSHTACLNAIGVSGDQDAISLEFSQWCDDAHMSGMRIDLQGWAAFDN